MEYHNSLLADQAKRDTPTDDVITVDCSVDDTDVPINIDEVFTFSLAVHVTFSTVPNSSNRHSIENGSNLRTICQLI